MSIFLGIGMVIFGVIAMGAPLASGVAVTYTVGFLVVAGGVTQAVFAFRAPSFGRGILRFLLGGLMVACGLSVISHPLLGLASLTLVLAGYFCADGIVRIIFAFDLRPEAGWGWMGLGGLVSVLLGAMIWNQWPLSGAWALGVLVGINLMMSGWTLIMVGPMVERAAEAIANAPSSADEGAA
jgi:uncharacterized membrane protein HdeD (DUF308 family)